MSNHVTKHTLLALANYAHQQAFAHRTQRRLAEGCGHELVAIDAHNRTVGQFFVDLNVVKVLCTLGHAEVCVKVGTNQLNYAVQKSIWEKRELDEKDKIVNLRRYK